MDTNRIKVIELRGSARERGEIHGEALRDQIKEVLQLWKDHFIDDYGIDFKTYYEGFHRITDFRPALEKCTPHLIEEVEGIATAAGVDFNELLTLQHGNEELWLGRRIAREIGSAVERCSTIASAGDKDHPAIICHNLDWDEIFDGYQVLFRSDAQRHGTETLLLSCAGRLSDNGINSHGVAVGDNAIYDLRPSTTGLPVFAIYRGVLECTTFDEAEHFIHSVPHASGLNWMIGAPGRVGMYEVSSGKVVPYRPNGHSQTLYHTNHALVNDDFDKGFMRSKMAVINSGGQAISRSTYLRWASLQHRFGGLGGDITVEDIIAAVSATDDPEYPVCLGHENNDAQNKLIGFTLASCIWELKQGAPTLHLASGPAATTPFRTFTFD